MPPNKQPNYKRRKRATTCPVPTSLTLATIRPPAASHDTDNSWDFLFRNLKRRGYCQHLMLDMGCDAHYVAGDSVRRLGERQGRQHVHERRSVEGQSICRRTPYRVRRAV